MTHSKKLFGRYPRKSLLKNSIVLLRSSDPLKTAICYCSSFIFNKMQVSCIKGSKTCNTFRGVSKIHLEKIYFTNINSFTKVTWLLQNKYLQLLQFNIGQKGRQRVLQVLNHKTHSEELWKYIWTIGVKIFFIKNGSFTKVMRLLLNCDLQLLQFGIRQKCQ